MKQGDRLDHTLDAVSVSVHWSGIMLCLANTGCLIPLQYGVQQCPSPCTLHQAAVSHNLLSATNSVIATQADGDFTVHRLIDHAGPQQKRSAIATHLQSLPERPEVGSSRSSSDEEEVGRREAWRMAEGRVISPRCGLPVFGAKLLVSWYPFFLLDSSAPLL